MYIYIIVVIVMMRHQHTVVMTDKYRRINYFIVLQSNLQLIEVTIKYVKLMFVIN